MPDEDDAAVEDAFTLRLPGGAGTPRAARLAIAERYGDEDRGGELLLCVSEVVTNAVLHAGSATVVTVRRTADLVTVEVEDDDPAPPVRRPPSTTATSGRGLRILDDLTVRWGTRPTDGGKVVWFDFDLNPTPGQRG